MTFLRRGIIGLLLAYLLVPILMTLVYSLSSSWTELVPKAFSLEAWSHLFGDPKFWADGGRSLILAFSAVALSIFFLVPTLFAITLYAPKLSGALEFFSLWPFVFPGVIMAVGLIKIFSTPPLAISGTPWLLIPAVTVVVMPYAYRAVANAFESADVRQLAEADTKELVVRVYGRNYEVLQAKAETVAKSIAEIPGVVAPKITLPVLEPTIEIEVNVDKASAKGVKPGDVRRAAATLISSITAGQMFEESKIFDVVVWGRAEQRDGLEAVKNTLVDGPNESQVRVGDVADVRVRPNPSVIHHDAVSRFIDVVARVDGRSMADVASAADKKLKSISFPSEHHVEVMGESTARERVRDLLMMYAMAAVLVL